MKDSLSLPILELRVSVINVLEEEGRHVPHGLGVRISDFHSDGPGSIPGVGAPFYFIEPIKLIVVGWFFIGKYKKYEYMKTNKKGQATRLARTRNGIIQFGVR